MPPLISLTGLHKSYFNEEVETPVLHGIDLKIDSGEFIAIMGPSGSGKSTLMHILGFLDRPTKGTYAFLGEDTSEKNDDALALIRATKVSFVFQAFHLLPRATVLENVMLPLLYHPGIAPSDREAYARKAIASVGLSDRESFLSSQLSGGQKQRTAIARALVTEPALIFADEPTGNLDSASGLQVMEVLEKLNAAGHTIILVTHERSTAEFADRIVHIKDGLIESDTRSHKRRRASADVKLK
ncbi:MAG: putative ABC transport system ATP-binding protein [Candidatus Peregrinibacteria bacterium Greene0416_62]|nr:MAG: putative ABC transport system ATP-binding protein [Candidatus Peregrinibacteria bacterium Greene0416_62]TSD00152.1 MAG: putative ABC transport system ATP-binding protein [Candidatus Peregrinibacteria bacterium Greene1014_49]